MPPHERGGPDPCAPLRGDPQAARKDGGGAVPERRRPPRRLCEDIRPRVARRGSSGRDRVPWTTPGGKDAFDRFQIPQKLYGRDRRRPRRSLAAFDRASGGRAELLLVGGYSGIGKSALVNELHRPVVARRGYFAAGKFDQLRREVPYASLVQAFASLVRQILTESEERLAAFRARIADALGHDGRCSPT